MPFQNRIRPIVAMRAMRESRQDPDDTAAAIRVISALSGNSGRRQFKRFQRSTKGSRILRERRDLFEVLSDPERMKAMPQGSLGRTIVEWFERENISTQGLAQASEAAAADLPAREVSDDERIYNSRLRNLHDVYHVLAGYDRDLLGESAVLAFTIAQAYNRGIAYLVLDSLRETGWTSDAGKLIREGYRRGKRAAPLVEQNWEALFEQPIDEVRQLLGVGAPPVYEQMRSAGAPALSA
jgi:ubiquinone biosynthesis protein COQ4